ncbi:MAG TPA: LysM domain-containing protein, partial [Ktedonobacterales bacterium]|nr:LysM domain-containing protein [Ktedonobacterales bacterium]
MARGIDTRDPYGQYAHDDDHDAYDMSPEMSPEDGLYDEWADDDFDAAPTEYVNPRATRKVPALSLDDLDDPIGTDARGGALVGLTDKHGALTLPDDTSPTPTVIIPGVGVLRAHPFIKRRPRSLTLRIAAVCLIVVVALTGLFTVTPLAGSASQAYASFQSLSGAVIGNSGVGYIWYTAKSGDTPESIASSHHVQLGGFYELNNLTAGQEIVIGQLYKIPTDPNYGSDYQPPSLLNVGA